MSHLPPIANPPRFPGEIRVVARVPFDRPRVVVIDKPAGMLSVPGRGPEKADCAAARVREAFPHATGPLVVHRLDMDTSGLLVFGLDPDTQRALSRQFERRQVEKRYTALLDCAHGDADALPREGEIDAPIRADIDNRPWQIHCETHGRRAVTRYRALGKEDSPSGPLLRVEFEPVTGRAHQLRVHAALPRPIGLGLPILGDVLYNPTDHRLAWERDVAPPSSPRGRLMLHAHFLALADPTTGAPIVAESPAPF